MNVSCPYVHYTFSTLDCGDCPQSINTTDNIIVCRNMVPGQKCAATIQTVLECGDTVAVSNTVKLEGTCTTHAFNESTGSADASVLCTVC